MDLQGPIDTEKDLSEKGVIAGLKALVHQSI